MEWRLIVLIGTQLSEFGQRAMYQFGSLFWKMYQFASGGQVFIYITSILPGYTFDYVTPTKHLLRYVESFP